MMKLFESKASQVDRDLHDRHDDLPALPEGVTVPDDIRAIPAHELTGLPGRPRPVRWMRWVPVGLLVVGGGVAAAMLSGDSATDPTPETILVEGPGSNSLNIPVIDPAAVEVVTAGPGSHSLNLTAPDAEVVDVVDVAADRPGSHSLNVAPTGPVVIDATADRPGSHSLNIPVDEAIDFEVDGPGSHSLNVPAD